MVNDSPAESEMIRRRRSKSSDGSSIQKYTEQVATDPSIEQEKLFAEMKLRQLYRDRGGAQKKRSALLHFAVMFIDLALIIFLSPSRTFEWDNGSIKAELTFDPPWWYINLVIHPVLVILLFDFFSRKRYFVAWALIFIYIPLFGRFLNLCFTGYWSIEKVVPFFAITVILQVVTLISSILRNAVYPKWIKSEFFQKTVSAKFFWSIRQVDPSSWTMTYRQNYGFSQRMCQYQGDISPDSGLPHGIGQWIDDSPTGESLTGKWKDGIPVAPFISRVTNSGDAFRAIAIIFYHASDDTLKKNKAKPTNSGPGRVGVASIECSVQGTFYKHLPRSTQLLDEQIVVSYNTTRDTVADALQTCYPYLSTIESCQDSKHCKKNNVVTIKSSDPRGIQIEGHIQESTGYTYVSDEQPVLVEIIPNAVNEEEEAHQVVEGRPGLHAIPTIRIKKDGRPAMPLASKSSFLMGKGRILKLFDQHDDPSLASNRGGSFRETRIPSIPLPNRLKNTDRNISAPTRLENTDRNISTDTEYFDSLTEEKREAFSAHLRVKGWAPAAQKEALVLLTGFSNTVEISFQSFGQLLSMTNICDHAYPIIFGWPTGTSLTYRHASAAANTKRNKEHFYQFIQGLQQSGIRRVHFLTHSMGVQTLLHAFSDDDRERGAVSKCFQLDPDFGHDENRGNLMICKSITLLNPDFPLEAFINHAFASIRRVCNQITVVGDRKDQALLLSSVVNGLCNWAGHNVPITLSKDKQDGPAKQKSFHIERRVGRELDSIHLPLAITDAEKDVEDQDGNIPKLSFRGEPSPVIIRTLKEKDEHPLYLDLDVIDTTNLDVNFDNVRHGGYNTNPILLKDLEDIIVTGQRAKDRPSLLFREGNLYSYCHAPSFITM